MTERLLIKGAPSRAGAYAHAVVSEGFVHVSGQGPENPATGKIPESFEEQVQQALDNMKFILENSQSSLANVVKVNAYLSELKNFPIYNEVFERNFQEILPARTTIGCQLYGIMFEIDCIAKLNSGSG